MLLQYLFNIRFTVCFTDLTLRVCMYCHPSTMEERVEGSMVVIGSVEERRGQTSQQQLLSSTGNTAPAEDGREEW